MFKHIIEEDLIRKAERQIGKSRSFVLVCHENPDGDALGSLLAMAGFLRALGKEEVHPVVPNRIPDNLQWLPGMDKVLVYNRSRETCRELISNSDVIIFLDFNELSRVGKDLSGVIRQSQACKVMLDHHPFPSEDAHIIVSYPDLCATAEVVFRYICRSGNFHLINKDMAECIYTGMMTDTGNFSYNSNKQDIYFIIGELLGKGIDKDAIYRHVYCSNSIGRVHMQGYVMDEGLEIVPQFRTSIMTLTEEKMKSFGCDAGDTDGFVNIPLSIQGVVLSVFFREDDGIVRVSLRSTGDFAANQVATDLFNGGGHRNAAGGRYVGTIEEGVKRLKESMPKYCVL